jgi:hypothetical protein
MPATKMEDRTESDDEAKNSHKLILIDWGMYCQSKIPDNCISASNPKEKARAISHPAIALAAEPLRVE